MAERADAFSTFRAGFDVRTRRLCRRVLMFHRFPGSSVEGALVRSTDFEYDDAAHLAKLARATVARTSAIRRAAHGRRGCRRPSSGYTEARIVPELHELDPRDLAALPNGVDGDRVPASSTSTARVCPASSRRLGDDLHYRRRPAAAGSAPSGCCRPDRRPPTSARTASSSTSTATVDRSWSAPAGSTRAADRRRLVAATPASPQLSTLDLADPASDRSTSTRTACPTCWSAATTTSSGCLRSAGRVRPGAADRQAERRASRPGGRIRRSDRHGLFLADMTGDGLQDIVRIDNGAVHYWPNLGRGRFGRRVTMARRAGFAATSEFDPRRVRLADIDGSGTTDIVYLDQRGARAWFNQSGNGSRHRDADPAVPRCAGDDRGRGGRPARHGHGCLRVVGGVRLGQAGAACATST